MSRTSNKSVTTLVPPQNASALTRLPSRGLQELWFVTLKKPWRTLALVPAQAGLSIRPLAEALSTIGHLHRGIPLEIISAEGMTVEQLAELTVSTQDAPQGQPGRLIVHVRSAEGDEIDIINTGDGSLVSRLKTAPAPPPVRQ